MGLESCVRALTQGLPPGVKPGANWMPSGCTHPPSYTLGQEPAPGLASPPVDLVIVLCCHTAQVLNQMLLFHRKVSS